MITAPILLTERLRLRAHRRSDFEPLAALYAGKRSRHIGGPLAPAEVWRNFTSDAGQWAILGYGAWAVEIAVSGTLVGQVGLAHPHHFPEIELGWLLFDGFEGRGYAFEAAERVRHFAAEELGIVGLVSYVDPDNERSIQLAERLGAVLDPTAPTPNGDPCLVYRHP